MTHRPDQWLVCMTTTPERLRSPFLFRVLDSLIGQQGAPPFQLLLSIPQIFARTGEAYPDPGFLQQRYRNQQLHIHRCPDHGPGTKFLGLRTWPGFSDAKSATAPTHIYIADDDIILKPSVFRRVYKRSKHRWWHPRRPSSPTVWANSVSRLGDLDVVEGYGGILIPADFFHQLFAQTSYFPLWDALESQNHPCRAVDDILLSRLLHLHGHAIRHTGLAPFKEVMDRRATDEHPEWFELCKHGPPRDDANHACLCADLIRLPR